MRFRSLVISAALLSASSLVAHADVITTFTLTHGADTFQFSFSPSTQPFFEQLNVVQEFEYHVPLTVDGVVQYPGAPGNNPNEGFEQLLPPIVTSEFYVGYASAVINGVLYNSYVFEKGPQVYTYSNGVLTFTPGTYVFPQFTTDTTTPTGDVLTSGSDDTLVITQGDAATPEPSTFWLLGTGLLGAAGMVGRRLRPA